MCRFSTGQEMKYEGSFLWSQQPASGLWRRWLNPVHNIAFYFFKIRFSIGLCKKFKLPHYLFAYFFSFLSVDWLLCHLYYPPKCSCLFQTVFSIYIFQLIFCVHFCFNPCIRDAPPSLSFLIWSLSSKSWLSVQIITAPLFMQFSPVSCFLCTLPSRTYISVSLLWRDTKFHSHMK